MKFSIQNLIKLGKIDGVYTIFGWVRSKEETNKLLFYQ